MRSKIAFPLDVANEAEARALALRVAEGVGVLKIGLELFVAEGPRVLAIGKEHDRPIFLDLKLHDIPETVERAVASACAHGVKYLTVHAAGGETMLKRAADRARKEATGLQILAVTVLTSMSDDDLHAIGVSAAANEQVVRLAKLAWDSCVRGFVCSPLEVASLRFGARPRGRIGRAGRATDRIGGRRSEAGGDAGRGDPRRCQSVGHRSTDPRRGRSARRGQCDRRRNLDGARSIMRLVLGVQGAREAVIAHGSALRVLIETRREVAPQLEALARFATDRGAKVERVDRSMLDRLAKRRAPSGRDRRSAAAPDRVARRPRGRRCALATGHRPRTSSPIP